MGLLRRTEEQPALPPPEVTQLRRRVPLSEAAAHVKTSIDELEVDRDHYKSVAEQETLRANVAEATIERMKAEQARELDRLKEELRHQKNTCDRLFRDINFILGHVAAGTKIWLEIANIRNNMPSEVQAKLDQHLAEEVAPEEKVAAE